MDPDRKINPLNVHNMRRVYSCPPHFTPMHVEIKTDFDTDVEKEVLDWIYVTLAGRFFLRYRNPTIEAGFELPEEATFFSLKINDLFPKR